MEIAPLITMFAVGVTCWYGAAVLFLFRGLRSIPPRVAAVEHGLSFSVVVAARNEADNIGSCLETLFSQTLSPSRYEVIVVNDRSTDATAAIVQHYQKQHANLQLLTVAETPAGVSPKKHAVAQGVAASRHEIIVFTDADCLVLPRWLATIDFYFDASVGLVQGITSYQYLPGMNRLFFNLQAVDFISHGIVAAAGIGASLPINSNANNFAFRREAFLATGGFDPKGIGRVVSGDDDLLLQQIWQQGTWGVVFMADSNGSVATMPTRSLKALFGQRARWGSKTVHYNRKQVTLLAGIFLFYCVIAGLLISSMFFPRLLLPALIMLVVKIGGEILLMIPGTALFHHTHLRTSIIPASLMQLPLVIGAVVVGIFGKFTWKGQLFSRTIKSD